MDNFNNFRSKVDDISTFLFIFLEVPIDPSVAIIKLLVGDLTSSILLVMRDELL